MKVLGPCFCVFGALSGTDMVLLTGYLILQLQFASLAPVGTSKNETCTLGAFAPTALEVFGAWEQLFGGLGAVVGAWEQGFLEFGGGFWEAWEVLTLLCSSVPWAALGFVEH